METRKIKKSKSTADVLSILEKTPLGRHVMPCVDEEGKFSKDTVSVPLDKWHEPHSTLVGTAISTFNASHSEGSWTCPVRTHGTFAPDAQTGYAKYLHLGTTRIWNRDGTINEERWDRFVNYVTEGQIGENKIVTQSKLKAYLDKCYYEDVQELDTGRNNNSLFSSKPMQGYAATSAWDEVYKLLTCGWTIENNQPKEPYLTLDLVRQFFEDTGKVMLLAANHTLPKEKPVIAEEILESSCTFKK